MHAYDVFCYVMRWSLAIVLGGLGWLIIISNFRCVYFSLVRRECDSFMPIPVIAGVFALVGMAFCPVLPVRKLAWIPLVLDVGLFIIVMTTGLLMQLYAWRAKKKKGDA